MMDCHLASRKGYSYTLAPDSMQQNSRGHNLCWIFSRRGLEVPPDATWGHFTAYLLRWGIFPSAPGWSWWISSPSFFCEHYTMYSCCHGHHGPEPFSLVISIFRGHPCKCTPHTAEEWHFLVSFPATHAVSHGGFSLPSLIYILVLCEQRRRTEIVSAHVALLCTCLNPTPCGLGDTSLMVMR